MPPPFWPLQTRAIHCRRKSSFVSYGKRRCTAFNSEWLQKAPVEAIIAARTTYMNDLAVQETVLQQQYAEETAALQINAELARQCVLLCSMHHNEQ